MAASDTARIEAIHRQTEMALPALVCLLAIMGGGIFAALTFLDGPAAGTAMLWLLGAVFAGVLIVFAAAYRVHSWTIQADGILIDERPRIPLAGFRRRATVSFSDIAAVQAVESGFDQLSQIVTRAGATYRIPDAAVAERVRDIARRAGFTLPATSQALSFWNRPVGLGFLLVMLLVSLAIALLVGWALLDGGLPVRPRSGEFAAIAILLPFGAGYAIYKALRRRRAVLAELRGLERPTAPHAD